MPPKPNDFTGSDQDWRQLNSVQPESPEQIESPSKQQNTTNLQKPGNIDIPQWLGTEDAWQEIQPEQTQPTAPSDVMPIAPPEENTALIPSGLSRGRPGPTPEPYKVVMDDDFVNFGPKPEEVEPADPASLFDEVLPPGTPMEERNKKFSIREKIWYSLNTGAPLDMVYETLPDRMKRTFTSTRTVEPDYVYWAGTNRHIMVSWDHLRNDWRAFAVDRIKDAKLEGE